MRAQAVLLRLKMPEPEEFVAARALRDEEVSSTVDVATVYVADPEAADNHAKALADPSPVGVQSAARRGSAPWPRRLGSLPVVQLVKTDAASVVLQVGVGVGACVRACVLLPVFATPLSCFPPAGLSLQLLPVQIMFEWFIAVSFYTYTAWLPAFFRSQGIAPVTTQVSSPPGQGNTGCGPGC